MRKQFLLENYIERSESIQFIELNKILKYLGLISDFLPSILYEMHCAILCMTKLETNVNGYIRAENMVKIFKVYNSMRHESKNI